MSRTDRRHRMAAQAQKRYRDKMVKAGFKMKRAWVSEDEMESWDEFVSTLDANKLAK